MNRREQQEREAEAQQLYSDNLRQKRYACKICDGVGYRTNYYLATYHGFSWGQLRSAERIADYETSLRVTETLRNAYSSPTPPTMAQQVISSAKECVCRKGIAV